MLEWQLVALEENVYVIHKKFTFIYQSFLK